MDKERIVELREKMEREPMCFYGRGTVGRILDALEAALARAEGAEVTLAKERIVVAQITNVMEAQAAAQGVVPDLTDEEVDAYTWEWTLNLIDSDEDWVRWSRRVGRWAYALAISRIPASRVLKEGEAVVSQAYLDAIENAANQFCGSCRDKGSCSLGMMAIGKGCGAWRLDAARINALRTQPTEGGA